MEKRKLGTLEVSAVGLGCNNFGWNCDEKQTAAVVDAALDNGINFLDTADIYGNTQSEELLGKVLAGRRNKIVLATKFGMAIGGDKAKSGGSARWAETAIEDSLRRLKTDYIDLYQLHFPDPATPIEETLTALDKMVKAGKVRAIGCSNFSGAQIEEAAGISEKKKLASFVSVQNHLSLLKQATLSDIRAASQRHGLGILPYFPLESGVLTGKYRRGAELSKDTRLGKVERMRGNFLEEKTFDKVESLEAFAQKRGHTLLELAFAWLLAEPLVSSVIAGATKPEQVIANAKAANWRLNATDAVEAGRLAA